MRHPALALIGLCTLTAAPAAAQSMNIPMIVHEVTTEICGPFMQGGDMAGAVRAAMAQGYRPMEWSSSRPFDPDSPPSMVVLDGRAAHIGTVTLSGGPRWRCAVDMAEATAGQIAEAAAEPLSALGLTPVLDRAGQRPAVVVWTGDGRQAVAAPGVQSRGHALTFSWIRPETR